MAFERPLSEEDRVLRPKLDPWDVSEADFPTYGDDEEKLRFAVRYAILAPSSHNSQPWFFMVKNNIAELLADRTRALPIVDPDDRELTLSCGAALFNLETALRHFGIDYKTEISPFPHDLLARVAITGKKTPADEENRLFYAIQKRHTNRMPFEKIPVPPGLIKSLEEAALAEGAWFHPVENEEERNAIADIIAEGDRIQGSDRRFRRELSAWVHPNRDKSRDGMPGYAFGVSDIPSYAGPMVIRTFDWGQGRAAKDRELAVGSPLLAVLGTNGDTAADWVRAGIALERVLLKARSEDVWASFLNQPLEVPELRPKVAETLKRNGHPQLILRMGYGPDVKPTPRRNTKEVLL